MYFKFSILNTNTYLTVLLGFTSIYGDYLVYHTRLHFFQAIFDNATHALIACLSWLIICLNSKKQSKFSSLIEIGLCSFIASIIDIDHFFSARSFNLREATNLKKRPFLHCSTPLFALCLLIWLIGYVGHLCWLRRFAWIFLTAFFSHHTRDATRRGFWISPFGSTEPLPMFLYVGLICFIPHFVWVTQNYIERYNRISYVNVSVI